MESDGMDILFHAKWWRSQRGSGSDQLYSSSEEASGFKRLLLALAIIAAIVGLLGHAASTTADVPSSNQGELP